MATSALPRPSADTAAATTTTAAAAPTIITAASCFKCGVRGHWSRDCTASKAEQDAHRREREAAEAAASAVAEAAAKAAADAAAAQAYRRKKKLTLEDLKVGKWCGVREREPNRCERQLRETEFSISAISNDDENNEEEKLNLHLPRKTPTHAPQLNS